MKRRKSPHTVRILDSRITKILREKKAETGISQTRLVENAIINSYAHNAQPKP